MYDSYDVYTFSATESPLSKNWSVRVRNCWAKALNRRMKLPRYVIVLLDEGILTNTFLNAADRLTKWLVHSFERSILSRYEQLLERCKVDEKPKIIYIYPVIKPLLYPCYTTFRKDRRTLITALENTIESSLKISQSLNVNSVKPMDEQFFT